MYHWYIKIKKVVELVSIQSEPENPIVGLKMLSSSANMVLTNLMIHKQTVNLGQIIDQPISSWAEYYI